MGRGKTYRLQFYLTETVTSTKFDAERMKTLAPRWSEPGLDGGPKKTTGVEGPPVVKPNANP